jgi:hypothetical protein
MEVHPWPAPLLDDDAARDALVLPTAARGADWILGGLAAAVGTPAGSLADARREVDDGLYRSRWERATPAERDLLHALASIGSAAPAPVADIARTMAKARTSDISVARVDQEGPGVGAGAWPARLHRSRGCVS